MLPKFDDQAPPAEDGSLRAHVINPKGFDPAHLSCIHTRTLAGYALTCLEHNRITRVIAELLTSLVTVLTTRLVHWLSPIKPWSYI